MPAVLIGILLLGQISGLEYGVVGLVIFGLMGMFTALGKWMMARMDKKDAQIALFAEEIKGIALTFNETTNQFQDLINNKLSEWEKNRDEVLCANQEFHQKLVDLQLDLQSRAQEAIERRDEMGEDAMKFYMKMMENADNGKVREEKVLKLVAEAVNRLERVCNEFEINGNRI